MNYKLQLLSSELYSTVQAYCLVLCGVQSAIYAYMMFLVCFTDSRGHSAGLQSQEAREIVSYDDL